MNRVNLHTGTNLHAEERISKILEKKTPYKINMFNVLISVLNNHVYPPGPLTKIFMGYLIENELLRNKIVADIGAATFALGILAAKNGAKKVVGVEITDDAFRCAYENIISNHVENKATILQGNGLAPLLPKCIGTIDLILCGAPWDTISTQSFNELPAERKSISRSFYDINNELIISLFSKGTLLLSPGGKIFITASLRVIDRIEHLCTTYDMRYTIVKEEDVEHDGNAHYILEITKIL